jgi:hypothetical protein
MNEWRSEIRRPGNRYEFIVHGFTHDQIVKAAHAHAEAYWSGRPYELVVESEAVMAVDGERAHR